VDPASDLNTKVTAVIGELAPLHEIKLKPVKGENSKPWYNEEIHSARICAETMRGRTVKRDSKFIIRCYQRKAVVALVDSAKSTYLKNKIMNANSMGFLGSCTDC
jgi:hypothetical protein